MREILFRGKSKNGEKWICGSLIVFSNGEKAILPSKSKCFIPQGSTTLCTTECHDVLQETVGQYTGVRDRNGVKIFDGDIVRYVYEPGEGFWNANQLSIIEWKSTGFYMRGVMGTNKYACMDGWLTTIPYSSENFEVVGNIHDNPELIEKQIPARLYIWREP